jgi:hypothetical protein
MISIATPGVQNDFIFHFSECLGGTELFTMAVWYLRDKEIIHLIP